MPEGFGGMRFDFTADYHITVGEHRPVRHHIVDKDGADITSFAGWTFEWFVRRSQNDGNGLDQLRLKPIFMKVDGEIGKTAPFLDASIEPDDLVRPGNFWHELWRTDTGNEERLSSGDFVVVG